jgi:uroporphyrinogen III methyltransferase/synthase
LAAAGLKRLGMDREPDVSYHFMNPQEFLPAAGQGILALEIREGSLERLMSALDDKECRFALEVERDFLRLLGGSCNAPCGVFCEKGTDGYEIRGMYAGDGVHPVYGSVALSHKHQAKELVAQLAQTLQTSSRNNAERKRQETTGEPKKAGEVFLVGAGPGRKGWLTLEALDCIRQGEVILYDALISPSILNECSLTAELIYVGKRAGSHAMKQEEINRLLEQKATERKRVVRLKGGDPFVFGRGGEEVLYLGQQGISCHVISGISSAYSVPARFGIPVTHRGKAGSFHVITGHTGQGVGSAPADYETLANLEGTLVFLMGLKSLEEIVKGLLRGGKSPQTPAAVISRGGTAREQKIVSSLEEIVAQAAKEKPPAPAVIVIGDVVGLWEELCEKTFLPLQGKRILLTGTRSFLAETEPLFEQQGAETVSLSLIETVALREPGQSEKTKDVFCRLCEYQWIVFTSGNGVRFFFQEMKERGVDRRNLGSVRFAVVGRGTARKLSDYGYQADVIPSDFRSSTLASEWIPERKPEEKILLVRGKEGSDTIEYHLKKQGNVTDTLVLYETVTDFRRKEELGRIYEDMDYVMIASGSAARALSAMLPDSQKQNRFTDDSRRAVLPQIVAIGPETAKVCRKVGLSVDLTAQEHTGAGLVRTVLSQK